MIGNQASHALTDILQLLFLRSGKCFSNSLKGLWDGKIRCFRATGEVVERSLPLIPRSGQARHHEWGNSTYTASEKGDWRPGSSRSWDQSDKGPGCRDRDRREGGMHRCVLLAKMMMAGLSGVIPLPPALPGNKGWQEPAYVISAALCFWLYNDLVASPPSTKMLLAQVQIYLIFFFFFHEDRLSARMNISHLWENKQHTYIEISLLSWCSLRVLLICFALSVPDS